MAVKVGTGIGLLAVVVLLLLWLAGTFHPKVAPAAADDAAGRRVPAGAKLAPVRSIRVPRMEAAVGSIRAVHETSVASKLLARVVEVGVQAGRSVEQDEVLVRLDDADLKNRLEQAEAVLVSAEAQRDQARIEADRVARLIEQHAASGIENERTQTALKSAEAEWERARQSVAEAETVLAYATIRAPMAGVVVDKRVDTGDMVVPGQTLVTLYDPSRMQLVASVRESLTHRLAVGQTIGVQVDALKKVCEGRVSEIVPEAESASRSFAVKVTGPCPPGIYSGMFGRILIPLDDETMLVVPAGAVRRVGQVEMVDVAEGGRLRRRAVQLGSPLGEDRTVLAGLREGEEVLLP